MEVSLPNRVDSFKRISSLYLLPEAHKLFILQVYSGVKKCGSFDGFYKKDIKMIKQIILLLKHLKMHYKLLDLDRNLKILFSQRKQEMIKLSSFHRKVFEENACREEYGRLLSYPDCCTESYIPGIEEKTAHHCFSSLNGSIFNYNMMQLDYRLNRFCGYNIISHNFCKPDCHKTIALANRIIQLYKAYDPLLAKKIIDYLKKPVLLFNLNNFIRFYDIFKNNAISYSCFDCVRSAFLERGHLKTMDRSVGKAIKFLKKGNKIIFKKGYFSVFKGNHLVAENHACRLAYLLLIFK